MSNFVHAPITKFIAFMTGTISVLANVFHFRHALVLDKPGLGLGEYWRLVTSHFVFLTTGEMVCGLILLYAFRLFERQMGSKKYGVFVLLSLFIASLIEFILLHYEPATLVFGGPYAIIFAQIVQYFYDVPSLDPVPFFGVPMNDKIFTYLPALHLIFAQYPTTGYYALCGIVAGLLYRIEFLRLEKLVIPSVLAQFSKKYFLPLLNRSNFTVRHQQHNNLEGIGNMYNFPQPARQPSGRNVDTLVGMGIDRQTAVQTLARYNDELQIAIENLFPTAM